MERPELNGVIEAKFGRYVNRVIGQVKRLPKECCQSNDSRLKNVWEEWIVQMQGEHSFFFEAYEETIRSICRRVATSLPREEQGLLWLWTDGYCDYEAEDGRIPYGEPVLAALEQELYERVCTAAGNAELSPRLERYLEAVTRD